MIWKFKDTDIAGALEKAAQYVDEREGIFTIEVKKFREDRSVSQNNYWWAICMTIASKLGTTKEAVHKMLNQENNAIIINLPNGKMKLVPGDTKSMKTDEFAQLITKARTWAQMELNLYIQTPEEFRMESYLEVKNEYEKMFY